MSEVILVTSGKGGVGKSTISTLVGYGLAKNFRKVLLIELDNGLRCLDILNNISDKVIYDIGDVLEGNCRISKAIIKSNLHKNLSVVVASNNPSQKIEKSMLCNFLKAMANYPYAYEYIIIDAPAGLEKGLKDIVSLVDRVIIVTTTNQVTVRDSATVCGLSWENNVNDVRLIINRVPKKWKQTDIIPDLDAIIDIVGAQLIGVINEDSSLEYLHIGLSSIKDIVKSEPIFLNIAQRIMGEDVDLAIK